MPSSKAHKKRMSLELSALKKLPSKERPPLRGIPKNVTEVEKILHMFDAVHASAREQGRSESAANAIAASATRKKYGRKFDTAAMISRRAKRDASNSSHRAKTTKRSRALTREPPEGAYMRDDDGIGGVPTPEKRSTGIMALGLLLDNAKEFAIPDSIIAMISNQEQQGRFIEALVYKKPRTLSIEIHGIGRPATMRQLGDAARRIAARADYSIDEGEGRSELFIVFEPRGFFS